jgi:hypothetical protein
MNRQRNRRMHRSGGGGRGGRGSQRVVVIRNGQTVAPVRTRGQPYEPHRDNEQAFRP